MGQREQIRLLLPRLLLMCLNFFFLFHLIGAGEWWLWWLRWWFLRVAMAR